MKKLREHTVLAEDPECCISGTGRRSSLCHQTTKHLVQVTRSDHSGSCLDEGR